MPKESVKRKHSVIKRAVIVAAVILGLLITFDLTPFGGTIRYYTNWVNCGHIPVAIQGSGYWNSGVSHYVNPPVVNIFPGSPTYFCTAFQAEKHGYSANSEVYDFPVLKANNALCKKTTDPESETAATFSPCKD